MDKLENKKHGFIAIVGAPNAGKSTITNALLGQKLSIVSPKVQTTRNSIRAIVISQNTQIILTTSHRFRFTIQEWKSIFRNRGVEVVSIEKLPESDSYNTNRKEDILRWLAQRPSIDNYIILDDDKSLNDLPSEVKNKLILTQSTVGLTEADVSSFL